MGNSRLEKQYSTIRSKLGEVLKLSNIMSVPRLSKIVLNVGVKGGEAKVLQDVERMLIRISGQKPIRTLARKSIAAFKLRTGMPIGVKVTLRRKRMYEFLDELIAFVLPGVRDFQGLSTKLDSHGNYNLGIKDCSVFPEAGDEYREKIRGLNVTIHTTARNDEHGYALLSELGMPFRKT